MKPTYWECVQVCEWTFDFNANEAGKRPIGTLFQDGEWVCQCGEFDA